jgi:hypothetical protein
MRLWIALIAVATLGACQRAADGGATTPLVAAATATTSASTPSDEPPIPTDAGDASVDAADGEVLGNMFGDQVGDAYGAGGLGLTGSGCSGGGQGQTIGLGGSGTTGHGGGFPCGVPDGGPVDAAAHSAAHARMREKGATVNGRLPPEVVQRVVRQSFGRFRLCYENGLATNPQLAGDVAVRFDIDGSGAVAVAADKGSSLPDPNVVTCVVQAFAGLSFPAPAAGTVTVRYAIAFTPGP